MFLDPDLISSSPIKTTFFPTRQKPKTSFFFLPHFLTGRLAVTENFGSWAGRIGVITLACINTTEAIPFVNEQVLGGSARPSSAIRRSREALPQGPRDPPGAQRTGIP
jgi:hypothetical protein